MTLLVRLRSIKVPVKSKLSMCSEFVTPQKNVLLATQSNFNDKKSRQVHKISDQNLEKMSSSLCSQTLGACPLAALKPRPLAGKLAAVDDSPDSTVTATAGKDAPSSLICFTKPYMFEPGLPTIIIT